MLRSAKCPVILWCKFAMVSVLLQNSLGLDISDDENHQALVQLARLEKPGFWTFVEDSNSQANGVIPFARLGRKLFKLPQTLIPYPRTGRELFDTDIFDSDDSLMSDYSWHNLADGPMADFFLDGKSLIPKRAIAAFPPRFGRKKRSLSAEDEQMEQDDSERAQDKDSRSPSRNWFNLGDFETDMFLRQDRKPKSKNSFVPRVGKRQFDRGMDEIPENNKRAKIFQPRVGRIPSSMFSRMESDNPRGLFQVKSRGAFIPRVGRRASFVPRMGKKAKFSPRVGRRSEDVDRE
ncbi:hypothetical protein JTE90_004233 [Oedothorax gibbosus]|uniref:Pyrokinin n=1 Tax=Oedothorax gibbosus TaxID=931172 RepID=A0AAV6UQU7_9ARAC|nr:hypothetical protein JTE90_004233 [Oedothorax gibbosus]